MNERPSPVESGIARVLTQRETIEWLLDRSKRHNETVPLRRALVQDTEPGPRLVTKPGPLHKLIRSERALDLLLLVHAITAGGDFSVTERAETWGRATGASFATDGSASAAVSRLWQRLEELKLIERSFHGRLVKITKLLEDGSGKPYARPGWSPNGPRKDVYFQLPYQYWHDDLHNKLKMAAKTVMLIGLSLRRAKFALPETAVLAGYYGISDATLRRGIEQLREADILRHVESEEYITGETITGIGVRKLYSFRPPYDLNVKAQQEAEEKISPAPASAESGTPTPVFQQPFGAIKPTVTS